MHLRIRLEAKVQREHGLTVAGDVVSHTGSIVVAENATKDEIAKALIDSDFLNGIVARHGAEPAEEAAEAAKEPAAEEDGA